MSEGSSASSPPAQPPILRREKEVKKSQGVGLRFQDVGTAEIPKTPVLMVEKRAESPSSVHLSFKKIHPTAVVEDPPNATTNNLACPFASMKPSHVGDSQRTWSPHGTFTPRPDPYPTLSNHEQAVEDPIAAESRHTGASSPPPSANGSTSKCPIRFLDQHSPEEVAEYFKHHKHEIPRSHEVCVRRYQSNTESIRQLDAKYGNLVTMIQDLGIKHQSLLPNHELLSPMVNNSMERVKKWADTINDSDVDSDAHGKSGLSQPPFKEVQVGESADMPWGVRVPIEIRRTESTPSARDLRDDISCRAALSKEPEKELSSRHVAAEKESSPSASRIYCPGPVCLNNLANEFQTWDQLAFHILNGHSWKHCEPEPGSLDGLEHPPFERENMSLNRHEQTSYESETRPLDGHRRSPEPETRSHDGHDRAPIEAGIRSLNEHAGTSYESETKPPERQARTFRQPSTRSQPDHERSYASETRPPGKHTSTARAPDPSPRSGYRWVRCEPDPAPQASKRTSVSARPRAMERPQMVFTGPVFIGYGAEEAAAIMRDYGSGMGSGGNRYED